MADLPPNHHADYRQFNGLFGYLGAMTMVLGRGGDAELVADLAGLQPNDHVVDLGCGPGPAVRRAAQRSGHVIGVDPSGPMLRIARLLTMTNRASRKSQTSGTIEWVEAGAEDLPLPSNSVTVCTSLKAVHHWPDLQGGITEVKRILRPGGRFVVLEKLSPVDATGNDSHGWTRQQATTFAEMLAQHGFASADVGEHTVGQKQVLVVIGVR